MAKRRRASYVGLSKAMLTHEAFTGLSAIATKLLVGIAAQYNGYNNGDLACSWGLMKNRGWKSPDTLNKARRELIDKGFLVLTRQGMKYPKRASLYAVTWKPIDDSPKLEEHRASSTALDWWKRGGPPDEKISPVRNPYPLDTRSVSIDQKKTAHGYG